MRKNLFDSGNEYKLEKKIRTIEMFAGYGSQALANKYLGVDFEHWKICEWAIPSIQAYKDIHFTNDNTDYSKDLTKEQLIDFFGGKISADYNSPLSKEKLQRYSETKLRTIYNNAKASHNLLSICTTHGEDLEIVDTDKYEYLFTFSWPCQDLSLAGKQLGMSESSGTRSSMLWEVKRILTELNVKGKDNLPKLLLAENVPQAISDKFYKETETFIKFLYSIGYSCFYKVLNAKDFGIPQNRERFFMVCILGDYSYQFPSPYGLDIRLKHILETDVDESYYLTNVDIERISGWKSQQKPLENIQGSDSICPTITARGAGEDHSGMILVDQEKSGAILSKYGTSIDKITDVATALCARDSKGFGNQGMTGVVELDIPQATKAGTIKVCEYGAFDANYPGSKTRRGRVQDGGNVSPTLMAASREICVVEPLICASRGRNPENPSDRTAGSPTEQRFEIGGDISNTLTTVQKDNYVIEPQTRVRDKVVEKLLSEEKIREGDIFDLSFSNSQLNRYHTQNSKDNTIAPTIMTSVSNYAMVVRDEPKTICINPKVDGKQPSLSDRVYDTNGVSTTIATTPFFTGSILEPSENMKTKLCNDLVDSGIVKEFDVINHSYTNGLCGKNPNSRKKLEDYVESDDNMSPTLTTRPDTLGVVTTEKPKFLRIRKLTERECFRLMAVKGEDFDNIKRNQSRSALYHEAGDSIVVACLMAILGKLYGIRWREKVKELVEDITKPHKNS